MKISTSTIRYYQKQYQWPEALVPTDVNQLADSIGSQLGAIEEITDIGSKYQDVLIVKIVSCVNHPNADRLHVCLIDDGKVSDVERDKDGYVQVVCGAPNVRAGLTVAWLPPGSTVPESVGKDPFVLGSRELRGVVSNGMLASPRELVLGDSHEGILEIDGEVAPGTGFAEHFNVHDDYILDIENKMFTHRPDCFGLLGVAREIAGIQHLALKSPDWYRIDAEIPAVEAEVLPLEVHNELPELVSRFSAITMRGVVVGPSPTWLVVELSKLGLRSINNIVDYTNYFMTITGQPLHAYDYDKVRALDGKEAAVIVVRYPKKGETIALLNGKEITPRDEAIMIATKKQAIGIGGVMGGADTEVDETTKNIIIEAANFDMYSIRRTSMAHGLFTDAVTRFNKGQSPLQTRAVLAKIVDEIRQFASGKVASELIDDNHLPAEVMERGSLHAPVSVTADFINARLGLKLSADDMRNLLVNVEFDVNVDGGNLTVMAPFWRTDIEIPEDVVEEVGRLYGYDHLPLELPKRTITPARKEPVLELKRIVRQALSKAGANEVLTYSFVHGNLLDKVGQDKTYAFRLSNALSPDLQYYRLSLTPSLLDKVHANIKAGYDEFALFELGVAHMKPHENDRPTDKATIPYEYPRVAFVYAADDKLAHTYEGAAFYHAKQFAVQLLKTFGLADKVAFQALDPDTYIGSTKHKITQYAPGRTANVTIGNVCIGEVGEYSTAVRKALKLPAYSAGFEFDLSVLLAEGTTQLQYSSLSKFPSVSQDICFKVPSDLAHQELRAFVWQELEKTRPEHTRVRLEPLDIYQREDDRDHKQVTFRLSIASYEKTMRDEEVTKLLDAVAAAAKKQFGAERI
jgi:phenylalanyl-tRNA synthetase beta chain